MLWTILITMTIIIILINRIHHTYHHPTNYDIYRNLNIKELNFLDFKYLSSINKPIYITYSPPDAIDVESKIKKINMKDYIKTYLDKPKWYFKTEDSYDFLQEINLRDKIISIFKQYFPHTDSFKERISFWVGGKNTTTGYHTDIEDKMYLYVIKGKKKLQLIDPIYTKNMYSKRVPFSRWTPINFKNVDYEKYPLFKQVPIHEIILNEGDALSIPRNWWHCVENLEPTIAITYKVYRPAHIVLTYIPELLRTTFQKIV